MRGFYFYGILEAILLNKRLNMNLEENLKNRCQGSCELCHQESELTLYLCPPKTIKNEEHCLMACATCLKQVDDFSQLNEKHWYGLSQSMWSTVPAVQVLYRKLYLSRIADNMNVMLLSGIPIVRGLELTSKIVDNKVYEDILKKATEDVKTGSSISDAMMKSGEIPGIFIAMIKIGEETGQLGNILKTLAAFYRREVVNAIDTIVGLIEPIMIVFLGFGVAFLLASVLIPIYNISSAM